MYLDQRKSDFEKQRMSRVLDVTRSIVVGSKQMKGKKGQPDEMLQGPRDALKYLMEHIQQGLLLDGKKAVGGDLATEGIFSTALRVHKAATGTRTSSRLSRQSTRLWT